MLSLTTSSYHTTKKPAMSENAVQGGGIKTEKEAKK